MNNPLVELETPAGFSVVPLIKSPKSVASPVVAIVKNSIALLSPPPNTARVGDANEPTDDFAEVVFPKSDAFPAVAIVIKSIVSVTLGDPPPKNIPLVLFPAPPIFLLAKVKSPKSVAFAVFEIVIKNTPKPLFYYYYYIYIYIFIYISN